nr:MFS transporter [Nocardioides ginsengisegetis]
MKSDTLNGTIIGGSSRRLAVTSATIVTAKGYGSRVISGDTPVRRDVGRLWAAYAVSEAGTAVGAGALPLVALLVLHLGPLEVSVVAALSGIVAAVLALPLGSLIEFRPKRSAMVAADLARFAAFGSVPVAAAFGALTYAHLCAVAVVQALGVIAFGAASGAHLKALVPADERLHVVSRFETTFWTATTVGPPIGGALVSLVGATASMAVDAVSFLLSAIGVRRLRTPEPAPPVRTPGTNRRSDLVAGWREIHAHRGMRALFWNSLLCGGSLMMAAPLVPVLMLRDLGFAPWQYGLALGVPGLGGIVGALLTPRLTERYGARRVLMTSGVARTMWMSLIALATPGATGLVLIITANTLLLLSAGAFNPSFTAYRLAAAPDDHVVRVIASWSISQRTVQPMFMLAGGVLAASTSARTAILVAAVLLVSSAVLLPWRAPHAEPPGSAPPCGAETGGFSDVDQAAGQVAVATAPPVTSTVSCTSSVPFGTRT